MLTTDLYTPKLNLSQKVSVDYAACGRLARLLEGRNIPLDREDSGLPDLPEKSIGNFYFWLVAICHQTSPKSFPPLAGIVDGKRLRGWDFLSAKSLQAARSDPAFLLPEQWKSASPEYIASLFYDTEFGFRLTGVELRAELVRDLGKVMEENGWKYLDDMYSVSGGRIRTGTPNLLDLLSKFRAYRDPVRKKSYFFLALMRNTGVWQYLDNQNLGPPVDYHEVRGHLRLGTILVRDEELRQKLLAGEAVGPDEDVAIRQAVHDAIMLLSDLTSLDNPSQLHYLFWNVFRSCCTRQNPHCLECPPHCELPAQYVPMAVHSDGTRRCPFSDICVSAGKEPKFTEHVFETDFY